MADRTQRWQALYAQIPLCDVPRHFAAIRNSSFLLTYLTEVLRRVPEGGRSLETGIGSGFGAIWLSLRGVAAEGLDNVAGLVERARQVDQALGGSASFRLGDLFDLYRPDAPRYHVIHHQGVLEHFDAPRIRAALAQQVALAGWVVFSVPSVYYPFEPEFGDERLLPLEEWRRILEPFTVEDLRLYGDPQHGEREHVLAVLRGRKVDEALLALMQPSPYPEGISAIVHTRNEAHQLAECLDTLAFANEIVVCDMESTDSTVEIARRYTDQIIHHPPLRNFDRARNVSAMRARHRWVLYVDADERIPPGLGERLRSMTATHGDGFEAVLLPFRHQFAGHWMRCLYPGYTAPRLLKNGRFVFNARLHSGVQVDGRLVHFPADDPNQAVLHHSFVSLSHYLDKLNRYTDGEAENLHRDGYEFRWQQAVRHFVLDLKSYYDVGRAHQDGVHGFLYSFQSGFYRFEQWAKLYERRFRAGQLQPAEGEVPPSVEAMLEYALQVARERPRPQAHPIRVEAGGTELVWSGPFFDPSGYGEECRHFALGLASEGVDLGVQILPWSDNRAAMAEADQAGLRALEQRPVRPGFVQIIQNFPTGFARHPQAGVCIGRTMFETDRLPPDWVAGCNRMDAVWVPSEFNRETFQRAGVEPSKLAVIPGCFDSGAYRQLPLHQVAGGPFCFLSVFDWTMHKGWDVLLRGFLEAFEGRDDVSLRLKVWSTMGYSADAVRQQAADWVSAHLDHDLAADRRIEFRFDHLSDEALRQLYLEADAFVMSSRGEGWGRPYLEAMACGRPTIGTNWSGNTAFMTAENSILVDAAVVPVPEAGWREIPPYRGHRWAEPDVEQLKCAMRQVVDERSSAETVGRVARDDVLERFDRRVVARQIVAELARLRDERTAPAPAPPARALTVRWEGAQLTRHSLAHVNRELCLGLLGSGEVELTLVPTEPPDFAADEEHRFAELERRQFVAPVRPADIHVRHFFPPRFDAPAEGRLVVMQPWEYGCLPKSWIEPLREVVDQVWCYSDYVRQVYLASGIPERKLRLLPLGVDAERFCPEAPPWLPTEEPGARRFRPGESFVFAFVGGTIHRKGIDILLEAYQQAFTPLDEVCLLIKDTGTQTVYQGQNERERILALANDGSRPPIVYLDADLPLPQLAGVYTAADCLVMPYRGEGFLLPALESMACGRPVIVPAGGPTDDFVDEQVGWRVPAERRPFGADRVGPWEFSGSAWMLEVDPRELARLMRQVVADRDTAAARGATARQRVVDAWTWQHSTAAALGHLKQLAEKPVRRTKARAAGRSAVVAGAKRRPPRVSLCLIVRDEERVLDDCLSSAKPWFDEIVVVDTGSTDDTVAIAESHGAKVHSFPWCDDFSAARNETLRHATGDWIFWMDADDVLPESCGPRLHDLMLQAEAKVTGYLVQVHIPAGPGEEGLTVVDHVKLFRNRPELRFEGRIHEQILESIHRAGGTVERSDLHVIHANYDHSAAGQERKRQRDLRLLELDLAERPDHPFVLFNIGMTAHYMKDWPKAIEALERCLAVSKPHESTVRKAYALLASAQLEAGDAVRAGETIERGLILFPHDPELLFRAGVVYREIGDLAAAENCYVSLLTRRESGHIDSLDVSLTSYKAHHNLALIHLDQNRPADAEAQFRAALSAHPRFVPSLLGLADLTLRQGRIAEADRIAEWLQSFAPREAEGLRQRLLGAR